MALPNIFQKDVSQTIITRVNNLTAQSQPNWGKMSVAQMLAHTNVMYEMIFDDKHKKPNAILKIILKLLVKKSVVSEKPYSKNGQTAPAFIITDKRDLNVEKQKLIDNIQKVQKLGANHFDNKESHSFGKLSKTEWNNMFFKHLDHHLNQFDV